jgi:hypothetical protein
MLMGRALGLNAERVARAGRAAVARVGALRYAPPRATHHALPVRRPYPARPKTSASSGPSSPTRPASPGGRVRGSHHTMPTGGGAAEYCQSRWALTLERGGKTCSCGPQVGMLRARPSRAHDHWQLSHTAAVLSRRLRRGKGFRELMKVPVSRARAVDDRVRRCPQGSDIHSPIICTDRHPSAFPALRLRQLGPSERAGTGTRSSFSLHVRQLYIAVNGVHFASHAILQRGS